MKEGIILSKKMKKLLMSSLAAMMVFVLAACGNTSESDKTTLKLAVNDSATTLNFLYTILEPNINIISNLQEGLVQYDETGALTPSVAEEWTVSEDNLTYTFKLKEDAKWQDGTPVTANDFIYSIETRIQDKEAVYAKYYRYIKNATAVLAGEKPVADLGVTAPDDKTLVFTLEEPKAFFLDLLSFEIFYPLNQAFYEKVGKGSYGTSADTILSNGAFVLDKYDGAAGWHFKKNTNYWNAAEVKLEAIDVKVVKETNTQDIMWEKGELDVVELVSDQIDKYANDPALQTSLNPRMNYFYLSNNTGVPNPLLANKNFRAAIAHSIDKQLIVDTVLKDASVAADYFVPQNTIFLNGEDFREADTNFATPMFDVAKANSFLESAKSELGMETLTFDLEIYDLGQTAKMYENIKAQIEQNLTGVTVNLVSNPTQTYFQKLYEYNTPAAASQWEPDYIDVENFFLLFESTASQNFSKWNSPEYDALYKKAESAEFASNPRGRWELYMEAEKVLIEDYTIIPVYQNGATYLVKDNIAGYKISPALPHVAYKYISKN